MFTRALGAWIGLSICLPIIGQVSDPALSIGDSSIAPQRFATAQELAGKGRLEQAMNLLNQLAVQTPVQPGVERLRGIIFYQKDQLGNAVDAFAKAIAQDSNDRESIEMEGVSLFRMGKSAEALPYLQKARNDKVEHANVEPQYVLGLAYADVGRYDDARHAFAAQFGFPGDSAEAYLLAGRLFLRREFRDPAAVQANKALQLNPSLPLAHQLLGECALARGDVPAAIRELEAERKISALAGEVYDRLGDAYLRNEQLQEARTALNRAILLEPTSTGPYILLGQTLLKMKQPIQALQYLTRAAQMDPSNYITHGLLGQAYKGTGQLGEANREFKLAVDLQHKDDPKPAGK